MRASNSVVIGLVVSLPSSGAEAVVAALTARPDLRLGERQAHLLPLTAETGDPTTLHRELEAIPGVQAVDVAFVEVSQDQSTATLSEQP